MKINQKFAKKAVILTALVGGISFAESFYNEVQATGAPNYFSREYWRSPSGTNYCFCQRSGSGCSCVY